MFAKLFDTENGQCLVTKEDADDDNGQYWYTLEVRCAVPNPLPDICDADAEVSKTYRFSATDAGEQERDARFDAFDQAAADELATGKL